MYCFRRCLKIGISSGAGFAAVCITAFAPTLYFFTPVAACFGGIAAFVIVYALSWKGGLSPLRIILTGVAVEAFFTGMSSVVNSMSGGDRTGVASIVEGNITQKTWDNVNRTRIIISVIAVILASISTAVVGAISFLGLIVPHIGRILVGSDHKRLVPFSVFAGAFTFLLADTIGRTICRPYEVSAAVVMSVIGGPFFILLLRGKR